MQIQDESIFLPAPFCVSRFDEKKAEVEIVIIGHEMKAYKIDGVCAFMFRQFDGKKTVQKILERILAEYDVSANRAKQDLEEFINRLLLIELLQAR